MWFEAFQQDIRWYLEDDVGHIKHGECHIRLVPLEMELCWEAQGKGVTDVDAAERESTSVTLGPTSTRRQDVPIQEGHEIENDQDGHETKVQAPGECPLGRVRWTLDFLMRLRALGEVTSTMVPVLL